MILFDCYFFGILGIQTTSYLPFKTTYFMWRFKYAYFWLIGATFCCFLLARYVDSQYDNKKHLEEYVEAICDHIKTQEAVIERALTDTTFLKITKKGTDAFYPKSFSEQNHPLNLCIYQNGELIFWSQSMAFPSPEILSELSSTPVIFRQLSNGYFRIAKHVIPDMPLEDNFAVSFIPVKWSYPASLEKIQNRFEPISKNIPGDILIHSSPPSISETNPSLFEVKDSAGTVLCYLQQSKNAPNRVHYVSLFFYLLAFCFLGLILNKIALQLNSTNKAWLGPSFLLFTVFGLRYWSLLSNWTGELRQFEVFQNSFETTSMSIGDVLINIILLLWIIIFIHRHSKAKANSGDLPTNIRFLLSTLNYLAVILALLLLISMLKSLVLNSNVPFDFKNVFNLEPYSVVAVSSIILLLFSQFIFSHRMMLSVREFKLPFFKRVVSLLLATLIALPIIYFIDLKLDLVISILIAFIFILTYDIFADYTHPGLVWMVVWVIFFAVFSSGLLNKYNFDKAALEQVRIAKSIAEENDPYFEEALLNLNDNLKVSLQEELQDNQLPVKEIVEQEILKENYIYKNYTHTIYNPLEYDSITLVDFRLNLAERLAIANPIENAENLYFYSDSKGYFSYILNYSDNRIAPIVLEFRKAGQRIPTVYSELLSSKNYKGINGISKYDYAIQKGGKTAESNGVSLNKLLNALKNPPPPGKHVRKSDKSSYDFFYNHDDNTFVYLSRKKNGYLHPVSLFSYIFGLLILTVLVFAVINVKLKILPNNLNFNLGETTSLKNKIQFSTIMLTLMSFVIIAIISVLFLRNNWVDYHDNRLKRKVRSVQRDSEEWLRYMNNSIDSIKTRVPRLAVTHSIDVNLFNLKGELINASQEDIYSRGILPPRMNANAFFEFKTSPYKDFYQIDEKISAEVYTTAFVPLKDENGARLAYISVPYYSKQGSLEDEISDFMGNLLNVYVFLLLLAGIISVSMANSITKPLTAIGEKLQEVKLGKPNTPLDWETKDEVGTLISEYNKMIKKLDDSANLLAKSEREGAWREMAKQVAHEIKNPLTPMKLSIQYLKHAFQSNPDNIEPLMQRVSNTLIEQIDNLAHIANEFSNFAKMPRANNEEFVVNDLVESVHDLFKEVKDAEVSLILPPKNYTVFADRKQLMRVLNNLIKNAVEAIPEEKDGAIEVSLYEQDAMAIIKVSDNGVGIPEEMKKKVFVPNFTTKNSGTGLGLAISKNIIESVNGKIYYETEPNKGTDFFVELPIESIGELEAVS